MAVDHSRILHTHQGCSIRDLRNGFSIVSLHYSADPSKRSREWQEEAQKAYTSAEDWNREYELSYDSAEGKPVFPNFRRDLNVRDLQWNPGMRVWRGWDFGFGHPACVWGQVGQDGTLNILRELLGHNITIQRYAQEVLDISDKFYPGAVWKDAGDPACRQVNDKSERTTADILGGMGIRIQYRYTLVNDGINLLRTMMEPRQIDGKPNFVMDASCKILIDGAAGGYVLDNEDDRKPKKGVGIYEHVWDATRYLAQILFNSKTVALFPKPRVLDYHRATASEITGY